jgi:hypothetical protein
MMVMIHQRGKPENEGKSSKSMNSHIFLVEQKEGLIGQNIVHSNVMFFSGVFGMKKVKLLNGMEGELLIKPLLACRDLSIICILSYFPFPSPPFPFLINQQIVGTSLNFWNFSGKFGKIPSIEKQSRDILRTVDDS